MAIKALTKVSSSLTIQFEFANKMPPATKQTIIRAEGAQQNGFENMGLFASAVVIGNVAKLDNWTLNALSGAYLASRVAYNLLYINGRSDATGESC